MAIKHPKIHDYKFLAAMYEDSYFPDFIVDRGKQILLCLCETIEEQQPLHPEEMYKLTHAATEEFNKLAEEFHDHDSEIETVARH